MSSPAEIFSTSQNFMPMFLLNGKHFLVVFFCFFVLLFISKRNYPRGVFSGTWSPLKPQQLFDPVALDLTNNSLSVR